MKLLLDVGNSRVKWATLNQGKLEATGAEFYQPDRFPAVFDQLRGALAAPAQVVIASVAAPATNDLIEQQIASHWQLTPRFLTAQDHFHDLSNGYPQPARLGVDRWLAMVAARRLTQAPCLVVSVGTAVTIDAINGVGRHLGGLILPGLYLMSNCLTQNTAGISLSRETIDFTEEYFGRDTESGVAKGTLIAVLEAIERSARELAQQCTMRIKCLITGGDGLILLPHLSVECSYNPHLVLQGMAEILEHS